MQWLMPDMPWHSARNPGPDDYDFNSMTPEEIKMLFSPFLFVRITLVNSRDLGLFPFQWYRDDYYYSHTTIGVITLAVLISGLFNLLFRLRLRRPAIAYI
jgi:hypothetical protein